MCAGTHSCACGVFLDLSLLFSMLFFVETSFFCVFVSAYRRRISFLTFYLRPRWIWAGQRHFWFHRGKVFLRVKLLSACSISHLWKENIFFIRPWHVSFSHKFARCAVKDVESPLWLFSIQYELRLDVFITYRPSNKLCICYYILAEWSLLKERLFSVHYLLVSKFCYIILWVDGRLHILTFFQVQLLRRVREGLSVNHAFLFKY